MFSGPPIKFRINIQVLASLLFILSFEGSFSTDTKNFIYFEVKYGGPVVKFPSFRPHFSSKSF